MTNTFDRENLARYFIDNHCCWFCGKNGVDCFHHIHPKSDVARCSKSIFNSAPMHNYPCHINNHGLITTEKWRKIFLRKTAKYLFAKHIVLSDIDKNFLIANKKYYDKI